MKFENPIRDALLSRKVTIGSWIQVANAACAEILAEAGFDWLAVDCEHTDITVREFTELARGMYGRGPVPFARVRENDTLAIRQVLDAGAFGVIVPLISTPDEARRAVAAAKYPPDGIRGFCFGRMNNYGSNFEDHLRTANDNAAVVVMIESREAVDRIGDIVAVEGVDGAFIGPYDLSGSYGIPGQTADPIIRTACERVIAACATAGKSAGIHIVLPDADKVEQAIADGFTFIAVGADTVFLRQGATDARRTARGDAK